MSESPTITATPSTPSSKSSSSIRSKRVLVPKVWKRPHSTIYGKNVEFGSALYSDKIGELNSRKFNSELPWTMRNVGGSSSASGSSYNQGYLSNLLSPQLSCPSRASSSSPSASSLLVAHGEDSPTAGSLRTFNPYSSSSSSSLLDSKALAQCSNYADLLCVTNPSRYSKRSIRRKCMENNDKRIDFYEQYADFTKECDKFSQSSLLANEPLLQRKVFDNYLDYDLELGLFLPSHDKYDSREDRSLMRKNTLNYTDDENGSINPFVPLPTMSRQTKLLPNHKCQLASSPYGQSADGRKLSLGSINPHSYRPSRPQKSSTAHASDGEEFEFQDRSSPFYTDRWAGRTIRHFDSDLYSNANLFKSMIL